MMNEEEERTKASLPEDTKEYSKDDDEESKLPEEQRKEDPPETIKVTKKAKLSGVPSTVERVDSTPKPIPEAAATPDSDASPAHKTHVVIGEYDLSVPDDKVPLLGMMAASIILLFAFFLKGVYDTADDRGKYGVAVAVIAFLGSFVSLLLPNTFFLVPILNNFLFVWSFLAALVLTFGEGPFTETGNGYFALWAMVVFSASAADVPGRRRRACSTSDKLNYIIALLAASLVVLIALSYEFRFGINNEFEGEAIYGMVVTASSIIIVSFFAFVHCWRGRPRNCCERPILTAHAIAWIIAAAAMTFGGPFLSTGNGYFASWMAAIFSVKVAVLSFKQDTPQPNSV